jgi:hypothetical protein
MCQTSGALRRHNFTNSGKRPSHFRMANATRGGRGSSFQVKSSRVESSQRRLCTQGSMTMVQTRITDVTTIHMLTSPHCANRQPQRESTTAHTREPMSAHHTDGGHTRQTNCAGEAQRETSCARARARAQSASYTYHLRDTNCLHLVVAAHAVGLVVHLQCTQCRAVSALG